MGVEVADARYDLVQAYAGDTEMGVVFDADTDPCRRRLW